MFKSPIWNWPSALALTSATTDSAIAVLAMLSACAAGIPPFCRFVEIVVAAALVLGEEASVSLIIVR